jgi:HTH-type transcriptional regulator/antitoxin HipB
MRKSRSLSQLQLGQLLGVNQKRAAKIERNPGVTSFDQIARLIASLGGRIVIEMMDEITSSAPVAKPRIQTTKESKSRSPKTDTEGPKGTTSNA